MAKRRKKTKRAARRKPSEVRTRRRKVREMLAAGHGVAEIAEELGLGEHIIHRDVQALRRAAGRRNPWGDPAACSAGFIEDAENALQKVRSAQEAAVPKKDQTIYHNLVKLEWTMLIKFIEMTQKLSQTRSEVTDDDEEDAYRDYTNEELLRKARELGVDVTGFERAFRAADALRAEHGADDRDGPDDLGEAA